MDKRTYITALVDILTTEKRFKNEARAITELDWQSLEMMKLEVNLYRFLCKQHGGIHIHPDLPTDKDVKDLFMALAREVRKQQKEATIKK